MLTLWGRATSTNTMKILWALDELGLPHRRVEAGGPFGDTDDAAFRAMSPLGQVPCLQDGDFSLFESNAILRYLANSNPAGAARLYPAEPKARAIVDAWLDLQQSAMAGPAATVLRGVAGVWPGARETPEIQIAAAHWATVWRSIEQRLARHRFLAGDSLTIADIAFGPSLHHWFALDLPERPDLPQLRAWYSRLLARPFYRGHIAEPMTRRPAPPAPGARDWFRYDPNRSFRQAAAIAAPVATREQVMSPDRHARAFAP